MVCDFTLSNKALSMALSNKARKVVEGKERTAIDTLKRLVDAPLSALATDAELDALAAPLITTLHEYGPPKHPMSIS